MTEVKIFSWTANGRPGVDNYRMCFSWLKENCGTEGTDWCWDLTDDGWISGIVKIRDIEVATVVRLKFGI